LGSLDGFCCLNNDYARFISTLPEMNLLRVIIGLHWTAIVAEAEGEKRCSLASTLWDRHEHHNSPDVSHTGDLTAFSALELAAMVTTDQLTMRSVGMAAINAFLPKHPEAWSEENAEEVIERYGTDKTVIIVGHFPFIPRLRKRVGELIVLERHPSSSDLPESVAKDVIPAADVVAITGMTLLNHSLKNLLDLCAPHTRVILLGPSTPLGPIMFEFGIDLLCRSVVTDIDAVLDAMEQAANFRQVHRAGIRLENMALPGLEMYKEY
jgi:uncharacterized protein (DUF4213/DUF364 family)